MSQDLIDEQVQLLRIEDRLDAVSAQVALVAKSQQEMVHILERIARTEERQAAQNARQRKVELRVDEHQAKLHQLELRVERNTGWRGALSKAGWALLVAMLGVGGKMVYDGRPNHAPTEQRQDDAR